MDWIDWDAVGRIGALQRIEAEQKVRQGVLRLDRLRLRTLPTALFDMSWLRTLSLDGSPSDVDFGLAFLPAEMGRLKCLETLSVAHNPLADLTVVTLLFALRSLNCVGTRVSDLGPLADLPNLLSLHCDHTGVLDLEPLAGLPGLNSLHFNHTRVSDLAPLAGLSNLQSIECNSTGVLDLGPLARLSNLQSLECNSTEVSDLGPLTELSSLQSLECYSTRVSDLGPLAGLSNLQSLRCGSTKVSDLGPLAGLSNLQSLECRATEVWDLGPLAGLSNLQSLDCSYNMTVRDLRPLAGLSNLRTLSCDFTHVTDLEPLTKLPRLRSISAGCCPVAALPVSLIQQPSLHELVLTSAPDCPAELLSHIGFDNCLPRLRAHVADLQAGAEPQRTTKIVVLGNGRVGKTQLCRKLRGLPYDPAVSSTHGIVIDTADFPDDETLNLWDFGGQDIYHGAHALFMRTRAVFVIAWHPDFESTPYHEHGGLRFRNRPLAYWLAFVRAMGKPGSPIIIVQTRCDTRSDAAKSLPLSDDALDGLDVTSIAYSARTGRGRRRLDVEIEQAIEDLRARDGLASIGVGRARVIERLRDLREADQERPPDQRTHRVLDMATFEAICAEAGDVSSPPALLDYLHQCGLVFYDPGRFAGRILLDLSWALDAVYSVFDRGRTWRQLHGTGGRFTRETLAATVWGDAAVDEQRLFLHLMLSCGICFQHGEGRQGEEPEYVAPDLLPERAAIAHHLDCRMNGPDRRLVQRYDFLHPGLFRGLMARIGGKAGKAGVYWRHGLWVYVPRSRTQVQVEEIADAEGYGGRIEITMIGDDAELADWLRAQLAEQSRRFGSMCLAPETDELPSRRHPRADAEPAVDPDARAPDFGEMSAEHYAPPSRPRVYVSYAWKGGLDPAIVGQSQRGQDLAHGLVEALRAHGVDVHVDRDDIALGDRISAFVQRLVAGDHIFVVISERYLASPWCMAELHGLWTHSRHHGDDFLRRVTPLVLEGTALGHPRNRRKYALHWKTEHAELERMLRESPDLMGEADMRVYRATGEYYRHVSDMLALLNDKLMPRGCDLEALAAEGFAPLLALLDPPAG